MQSRSFRRRSSHFTANHLTDDGDKQKQYMKIHQLNTTQNCKQFKIQQNKTTLVQSPLTIALGEVTIWTYYSAPEPARGYTTSELNDCDKVNHSGQHL